MRPPHIVCAIALCVSACVGALGCSSPPPDQQEQPIASATQALTCDDGNVCTTDTGTYPRCLHANVTNGTTCNDSNACTQTDTCQNGVCTGSNPVVCTAQDQCHVVGTCNTGTGVCTNPNKADYTTCTDGNGCTQRDMCMSGVCTGSDPVICTARDQCHVAGTCNPSTGNCSDPEKANGSGCDDGSACTRVDTCQGGNCTGGSPVVCTALDQCHDVGSCNPSSGICSNPNKTNGTTCNDNNACTLSDQCSYGACVGTNFFCTAQDQCHNSGTCNPTTGACSNPSKTDGTACSDSNACTQIDTCQSGICTGSNPVVCTAQDPCHDVGTCNTSTGVCSNPNKTNGTACSDGNGCTQTDTCQSGTCTGSNPIVCTASDQCHNVGACSPASGTCSNPNKTDGTGCDDNNACTITDSCQNGVCSGTHVLCIPQDQCHAVGTCNPTTGVCTNPLKTNGVVCDDANACTQTDTCQSGTCTGSNPVVCTAQGQCYNVGTCAPSTGICSNPPKSSGTACTDSNACTNGDQCNGAGTCVPGAPLSCDDNNVCTIDNCNTSTGCIHPPASTSVQCSDNSVCTTSDHCNGAGTCTGTSVSCDDSNICTVDGCDSIQGCMHTGAASSVSCNDSNACTAPDHCNGSGSCIGNAFSIDDQNACTTDACDPGSGVSHTPKAFGTPCPDSSSSNGDELCNAAQTCVQGTQSNPVLTRVGGQDANVKERRLGAGRHPVATGSQGMAVAFLELLMDDGAAPRLGVATVSLLGEGRGVGRVQGVLEADPVLAALPDGSFALAYTAAGLDGDGLGVALVKVSSTGAIVEPTKVANQTTLHGQKSPDIIWTGTQLVVGWEDESQISGRRICSREFTQTLTPIGAEHCEPVADTWASRLSLTSTAGQVVMAWRSDTQTTNSVKTLFASHGMTFDLASPTLAEAPALVGLDAGHVHA